MEYRPETHDLTIVKNKYTKAKVNYVSCVILD